MCHLSRALCTVHCALCSGALTNPVLVYLLQKSPQNWSSRRRRRPAMVSTSHILWCSLARWENNQRCSIWAAERTATSRLKHQDHIMEQVHCPRGRGWRWTGHPALVFICDSSSLRTKTKEAGFVFLFFCRWPRSGNLCTTSLVGLNGNYVIKFLKRKGWRSADYSSRIVP